MRCSFQRTCILIISLMCLLSCFVIIMTHLITENRKKLAIRDSWNSGISKSNIKKQPNKVYTVYNPYSYEDSYDFRVIILTQSRISSLLETIESLNRLQMDADTISIEIWIDRFENNSVSQDLITQASAKKFNLGQKRIHLHNTYMGKLHQWLTVWKPKKDSDELILIIDDDVSVSPMAYRWLKAVRDRYSMRSDIIGYTLQTDNINKSLSAEGTKEMVNIQDDSKVMVHRLIGTLGLAPKPSEWKLLQTAYSKKLKSQKNLWKPEVLSDNLTTIWNIQVNILHNNNMKWAKWFLEYTNVNDLYCVYNNIKYEKINDDNLFYDDSQLAVNRNQNIRDDSFSSSYSKEQIDRGLLNTWERHYTKWTRNLPYIEYNGTINYVNTYW